MDAYKTAERIKNGKDISDEEWLQIRADILQFLKEDHPVEEKLLFHPLGLLEMVQIICNGIERSRLSDA